MADVNSCGSDISGNSLDADDAGSLRTVADEVLDEVLEAHVEDPAQLISTMMPSRQAVRTSWCHNAVNHPVARSYSSLRNRLYTSFRQQMRPNVQLRGNIKACRDSAFFSFDQNATDGENDQIEEENILAYVKRMPISMEERRKERDLLLKGRKLSTSTSAAWKIKFLKKWNHLKEKLHALKNVIMIWRSAVWNIEGHYGTSVAAVFIFIQWLFLLNLLLLTLVLIFIVIPQMINQSHDFQTSSLTNNSDTSSNCSLDETGIRDGFRLLQDFVQGTGWMTWTGMFYGYYRYNHTLFVEEISFSYNLPLAYLLVTLFYFGICLILMLINAAKGARENLFTMKGRVNECCNLVFAGWDYCINKEKKAGLLHEIIYNEIMGIIIEDGLSGAKHNRTKRDRLLLHLCRVAVNVAVICILAASGCLIYLVVDNFQQNKLELTGGAFPLVNEFMPSLVITALNIFVPRIFDKLVILERYSPGFVTDITLFRTLFLKLASIAVLLVTLHNGIFNTSAGDEPVQCTIYTCWETYVGQQIYKLAIMDFATGVLITFCVHFPRMLCATKVLPKCFACCGRPTFDIPNNVLDIVYSQTLCWLGTFYCPLLPVLNVVKCFIFFYVKQFSLFVNCEPSRRTYRASKSNALFTIVLLFSSVLAVMPVAYSIGEIPPSAQCGPFIGLSTMWDVVPETMESWPDFIRDVIYFLGTAGFAIPAILFLMLVIYFYVTVSSAHKLEIRLLQEQLIMERRDKQYLFNRLKNVLAYRHSFIATNCE